MLERCAIADGEERLGEERGQRAQARPQACSEDEDRDHAVPLPDRGVSTHGVTGRNSSTRLEWLQSPWASGTHVAVYVVHARMSQPTCGFPQGAIMNWDQIEGQWKQMGSHIKSKWAKLTDDDLKMVGAKKDQLIGKIQERYGILKDEAEQQVNRWMADFKTNEPPPRKNTTGDHPAIR
jgi:uncharacterized protein YjbJ (UPF0337 family)